MNIKKLIALTVLTALCLTTINAPIRARADTLNSPGQASSSAVITTEATILDVTTPLSVLIYIKSDGTVLTPDNMSIINHSAGPIKVTSLAVQTEGGWTLDKADTNYSKFKVGQKNFCLTFNGLDPATGAVAFDTPINGGETLNLVLSAKVSPQKDAIASTKIGNIVVTVGWADAPTPTETGSYPVGYALATDSDFTGIEDGYFKYVGTADYVVIPDTIKGITLTSYKNLFNSSSVKGVFSNKSTITDMTGMFTSSSSASLELSLNTASVTSMAGMFKNSAATNLNLSSFSTANVTSMVSMFESSKATDINLSTFDTSNVTSMSYMFANSAVTALNLNNFDTSKVTGMASMFEGSKVTALDLSNFNTANVTSMMFMFKNSAATSINLSGFNTSKIVYMGSMFEGSKATALNLSSFNTSLVTSMTAMFKNSAAASINLSSFATYQVVDFSSMFEGADATTLDLSSFDIGYPTPITASMFYNAAAPTGYARNAGCASALNASSGKPAGLTFTTK